MGTSAGLRPVRRNAVGIVGVARQMPLTYVASLGVRAQYFFMCMCL